MENINSLTEELKEYVTGQQLAAGNVPSYAITIIKALQRIADKIDELVKEYTEGERK